MPVGLAARGEMIFAVEHGTIRAGQDLLERQRGGFGDHPRPRRATGLVAHHAQFLALARQALHREHEILAARAVNPAQPENQMVRAEAFTARSPSNFDRP